MTLFLFKQYCLTKNKFHSEPPTKFSKRRGAVLTGSQFSEGGCLKRGGLLFSGKGLQFLNKK